MLCLYWRFVPATKANELWRNYQLYVEQFYDMFKLNIEAREYDFKKNLELKTKLCEAAEKLASEEDVISAFHQLQKLHQEYRETGPVAKELREEVWTREKIRDLREYIESYVMKRGDDSFHSYLPEHVECYLVVLAEPSPSSFHFLIMF